MLNYFGAVSVIKGTYDLLEKKHGSCVAVSSNVISQGIARMDIADLLNNCGDDEHKIRNVVSSLDASDLSVGNSIYAAAKYALARWVRRHSASYAANGVRINAVAPGNVGSAMTATMSHSAKASLNALPIPTRYGQETFLPKTATTATTVPTAHPSMTTIYMEKKPSPCFSGTNFSAASIPFWNRRC